MYPCTREFLYDREKALIYAHRWAYDRNPLYFDFENLGGDCTNFVSQAVFAGSGIMNYTPEFGWYYIDANSRAPSWTGVNFLYSFLTRNTGPGPFGEQVDTRDIQTGDIAQLSFVGNGFFNHSLIIVHTGNILGIGNILVATHTDDQDYYPLINYSWKDIRFIHIKGVRN